MIIDPSDDFTLDCYCDANFAGLWGCKNDQDPSSIESRTGFVLTLGGTPILWVSKMQSEIACSTMEAEYIALSHSMQELLPAKWLVEELAQSLGLERDDFSTISTIWENNNGALVLATNPMLRMTPRSKHIR
eukprot:11066846-Ditylum_brightwellii.AAC.1